MGNSYDLFLSHAWADNDKLQPLLDALRTSGLRVWFDGTEIPQFAGISQSVADGLARSKALLAFFSATYPTRRACQWELTAAYLAAERLGDVRSRVLVVNPEPGFDHIQPAALRDALLPRLPEPGDVDALHALTRAIHDRLAELLGTLGDVGPMRAPRWYGTQGFAPTRFVGRVPDLWQIHSTLQAAATPLITGQTMRVAQVYGMGGVGKSLIAEEYARRFGGAYPGGVFWLRAYGNEIDRGEIDPSVLEAERDRQFRNIAGLLGQGVQERSLAEVEGAIAVAIGDAGSPCLWVVDDLAAGMDEKTLRDWLAPHPLASTLVTTRSREYRGLMPGVPLGILAPDEAYDLLTWHRRPHTPEEESAAREIVEELGRHALALDISGAFLELARTSSFADFLQDLRTPSHDELELIGELSDVLPSHQASIAATLTRSIGRLSEAGREVLVLAASLALAPIPEDLFLNVLGDSGNAQSRVARQRVLHGLKETDDLCLTDRGEHVFRSVHALVARTVQRSDLVSVERKEAILTAAVRTLAGRLSTAGDPRTYPSISAYFPHARALAATATGHDALQLLRPLARIEYRIGAYHSAQWLTERASELSHQLFGGDAPETLDSMLYLGSILRSLEQYGRSREILGQVLQRSTSRGGNDELKMSVLHELAGLLRETGEMAEAREICQRVLEDRRELLGEEDHATMRSLHSWAAILRDGGELKEARDIYEELCGRRRILLGDDDFETLRSLHALAGVLGRLGEYGRAREIYKEVLEKRRRMLGEDHADTLTTLRGLVRVGLALGDEQAPRLYEEVLQRRLRTLNDAHPAKLRALVELARHLREFGEQERARTIERQIAQIRASAADAGAQGQVTPATGPG